VSPGVLIGWTKAAASAPSITRRSNEDDRFMSWRRTSTSPTDIGRSTILFTPTMATSGGLISGVDAMPPSAPRVVIVDRPSSSSMIFAVRAAAERRATELAHLSVRRRA